MTLTLTVFRKNYEIFEFFVRFRFIVRIVVFSLFLIKDRSRLLLSMPNLIELIVSVHGCCFYDLHAVSFQKTILDFWVVVFLFCYIFYQRFWHLNNNLASVWVLISDGLIPPTDVLASSYRVQSHEVQLTWTPVVQPKCVLTIGEEVSNSQLGQAVESAKLEILNQVQGIPRLHTTFAYRWYVIIIIINC